MYCLLFLEFIGTTELFVVLLFALIIFGPRKLPELSRSLAQALNQMRAASDDFKHTWEAEAQRETEASAPRTLSAVEEPAITAIHTEDLQQLDEAPASVAAQSSDQPFACEPVIHAGAVGTVFESQPVELHG
ncbi:MAG TPA: twin-arginine translocase TatA/TatE family subunit [Pyrinomonadaceae bacterium]|jgi:TatA/E family protein of Tat protein translocase